MTRSLRGTVEECRVAAVEPVGFDHAHLGPVSEEHVVFERSNSKRMRSLGYAIEDYFPGRAQHGCITVCFYSVRRNCQGLKTPSVQPLPVQTIVGDSLHGVKVAVRPVDPLSDNIKGNSHWSAKSALHQLEAITAVHEGTLELHLLSGRAHVCEEHIAANKQNKYGLERMPYNVGRTMPGQVDVKPKLALADELQ